VTVVRVRIEVSGPNDEALAEALVLQLMRSVATLGDVIDARATLEIALGPLAARNGNEEDWVRMRSSLDEFRGAVEREEWLRAHTEHLAFHEAMLDALHVPVLSTLLRRCTN
jgi:DNA-binding FadR family transcriptional regulator